jgi:hypothetical protein
MATTAVTPLRWARFTWDDIGEGREHLLIGHPDEDGNSHLACGRVRPTVASSVTEVDAEPSSEYVHRTCAAFWAGVKFARGD